MTFIDAFELKLAAKLAADEDGPAIVAWATEQVLQSYNKGIEAGRKGATVIRKEKSRRRSPSHAR